MHLTALESSLSRFDEGKCTKHEHPNAFRCACCDVAVAQINYPSLKHNTQDSIKQARGRSHEKGSSQIFMLDDMQFGGVWTLSRLKQKKRENYQAKLNKIRKLSRE
jgi:hypothetical protein